MLIVRSTILFDRKKLTPTQIKDWLEATSPFSAIIKKVDGEAIVLELKPVSLKELYQRGEKARGATKAGERFIEDILTCEFEKELKRADSHSFVRWVKEFIESLDLPTDFGEKAKVLYTNLLRAVRTDKGGINKLLIDYLRGFSGIGGLRFNSSELPVCQHFASLLAFVFKAAGFSARSTRIYEQEEYSFRREPRGLLVLVNFQGVVYGIDTVSMRSVDKLQESVHAWTEVVINGRLVPFDFTLDVDHPEREPLFCGELPPIGELPLSLRKELGEGEGWRLFHVYPLYVPGSKIISVNFSLKK